MRKIKLLIIILLLCTNSYGQFSIDFEEIINIESKKNGEGADNMKKFLLEPKLYTLKINGEKSLYETVEKINNSQNGGGFSIHGEVKTKSLFTDLINNTSISEMSLDNKLFYVKDSIKELNWIITKEKDTILGLEVKKAIFNPNENSLIEAWYAISLPKRFGPDSYLGLPGTIIKLKISSKKEPGSYKLIQAVNIKENKDLTIKFSPNKKEINAKEFETILNEYFSKVSQQVMDNCVGDCKK